MGGIFWEDFFWEDFLGGFFTEDFLGGFFWEEFFGRNYSVDFYKKLMFLSRFWGNFVSMEGRRKEDFRSLEVRRKLIALKTLKRLFLTSMINVERQI